MDDWLAFGTFWFWVVIVMFNITLLSLINWECGGCAALTVLAALVMLQFFAGIPITRWIAQYPFTMACCAAGYFVAGTGWAVLKWWLFNRDLREKYDEHRAAFLKKSGVSGDAIPEVMKEVFCQELARAGIQARPEVAQNKARILTWLAYWPWSLLWTILDEPFRRIASAIFRRIRSVLQTITEAAWRGTENDLRR